MLQNCSGIKDPFRVQEFIVPMDFIVTEDEKFIEMASDSTLQLTFKELLLVGKNIHNPLKRVLKSPSHFQLHVCKKPGFLHIC